MEANHCKAPPCPMCGKPDSARSGNLGWGHSALCCSNECGVAYASSRKRLVNELHRSRATLKEAEAAHKAAADALAAHYVDDANRED